MLILRNLCDSIICQNLELWNAKKLKPNEFVFIVNELLYYVAWLEELALEHEVERKFGWLLKSLFFGTAIYAGYQFFPYMGINHPTINSFPATISSSWSLCLLLVVQTWQCCWNKKNSGRGLSQFNIKKNNLSKQIEHTVQEED